MARIKGKLPSQLAEEQDRYYITSEDVTNASKTGMCPDRIRKDVLRMISTRSVEDMTCVAFTAEKLRRRKV